MNKAVRCTVCGRIKKALGYVYITIHDNYTALRSFECRNIPSKTKISTLVLLLYIDVVVTLSISIGYVNYLL